MVRVGRISVVWKHFVKTGDKVVNCNICNKNLCYYGNTSNMREHLKRVHSLLNSETESKNTDENAEKKTVLNASASAYNSPAVDNLRDLRSSNSANESSDSEGVKQYLKQDIQPVELMNYIPERKRKNSRSNSPTVAELNNSRKYSDIWNYCKNYKDRKATCLVCNKQISCSSTSNFRDHLERRHPHIKLRSKAGPLHSVQVDMSSFGVTDVMMDHDNHFSSENPLECASFSDEEEKFTERTNGGISSNRELEPIISTNRKSNNTASDSSTIRQTLDIDECNAYGTSLAIQLHQLEDSQRYIAEKLMSDVIYYARFGKLTDSTHVELSTKTSHRMVELHDEDVSKQTFWKINGETFYIANNATVTETGASESIKDCKKET